MKEPWEEFEDIWSNKVAFFTWLRSALRRAVWEKYPPKLQFKNSQGYKPGEGYTGKAKKLVRCALSGEEIPISKAEIDHVVGHVSLKDWDDVFPFIRHLCATKDNMQVVSKEAHKIKSYAERMGISYEQADATKQAIAIGKSKKDQEWLLARNISPASNAKGRREQIIEAILKEK